MGEGINGVWTIFKKGLGPLFPYSVHKKVHVLISNKWINKNISRHHKTIADCETQGNKCYNMKFKTIQTILQHDKTNWLLEQRNDIKNKDILTK